MTRWFKCEIGNLVIAASLAALVAIVLPTQTYVANASLFVFTPLRLALESTILFLALSLGLWLILATIGRWLGGTLQALLTAVLVCIYLESGILSAGLPEITGGLMPALAVRSRAIVDVALWAVLVVGFVSLVRFVRPYLHWIALAFLFLSLCSFFDVRKDAASADVKPSTGYEWQRDIVANFRFSPKRNALVFILDSMPGNVSYDLMMSDEALRKQFAGFTCFTNNVGMHDCTKYGLPGLMTGRYFEPNLSSAADYPMTILGEESFITPYARGEGEVFFVNDLLPYGFTNAKIEKRLPVKGKQKHGWAAFLLRSREVPYLSLFDTVVFRLVPYCAKAPFLYSKIRHDPMMGRDESAFWYEHVMYPALANAPFSDSPATLGVFHSRGAHPPIFFDPAGNPYPTPRIYEGMINELVSTPLRHLGRMLDRLRERKLYDNAFIVVVADHGIDLVPCEKGHHPSESAILWVKPEGATKPLSAVSRPTSYVKVSSLMREAAKGPLGIDAIADLLEVRERLFRYQDGDGFNEHVIGPAGEVVK